MGGIPACAKRALVVSHTLFHQLVDCLKRLVLQSATDKKGCRFIGETEVTGRTVVQPFSEVWCEVEVMVEDTWIEHGARVW